MTKWAVTFQINQDVEPPTIPDSSPRPMQLATITGPSGILTTKQWLLPWIPRDVEFTYLHTNFSPGNHVEFTIPNPGLVDQVMLLIIHNLITPPGINEVPVVSGDKTWTQLETELVTIPPLINDRITLLWASLEATDGDIQVIIDTTASHDFFISTVYGVSGVDLADPIVQSVSSNTGVLAGSDVIVIPFAGFGAPNNAAFTAGVGINNFFDDPYSTVDDFEVIEPDADDPNSLASALAFGRVGEIANATWRHPPDDAGNLDLKVAVELKVI